VLFLKEHSALQILIKQEKKKNETDALPGMPKAKNVKVRDLPITAEVMLHPGRR
jgi:hypothetical protein